MSNIAQMFRPNPAEQNPGGYSTRELSDEEIERLYNIGMSEGNIRQCTIDDNNVFHLNCRNSYLEGYQHPDTGIPFVRRQINVGGETIEGVFPVFPCLVEAQLPENIMHSGLAEQLRCLNTWLLYELCENPSLREMFTEDQLKNIQCLETPNGLTWHHNEATGLMQLVDSVIHHQTGHTGGDSIWGGRQRREYYYYG